MDVAILGSRPGWHAAELERALGRRGHRARTLPIDACTAAIGGTPRLASDGVDLEAFDAVLVRTIPRGSLEQIVFRMDVLHRLERLGIVVVNPPAAIERTVDKMLTSALLEEAGIPTPRTIVAERASDAMAAFRALGDVIVKPLFGSGGRGMVRLGDEEVAYRVFRALEMERGAYYIQQAIPHAGRDLRAFVVGDRVVAAMWRRADDWRTNLARGARAEAAMPPSGWQELGVRAVRAVGAEYGGVDLLPGPDGRVWVLEVNGIPGWRGLQGVAPSVDIAGTIIAHLERRLRG